MWNLRLRSSYVCNLSRICLLCSAMLFPTSAMSGGLLGDAVEGLCGGCGAGKALDDAHREIKKQVPPYGRAEEGISGGVRKGFEELNGEVDGPILAEWIRASRNDVINAGARPIPPAIYNALQGYFPDSLLQKVRFRAGWGNEVALPVLSFRFGDAAAITLDDVVMFRDWNQANNDVGIWAHELTHVQQYERWGGILALSKRYVKSYKGVEHEAENNARNFVAWYNGVSATSGSVFPGRSIQQSPPRSNICRTQIGACVLPMSGPLNAPCWCASPYGPVSGLVMP